MNYRVVVASLVLCLSAVLVTGCPSKPKTVKISGTVTVAGEPVDVGAVMFKEEGKPSEGATIKKGAFECEIQPGTKKVIVEGVKIVGQIEADPMMRPGVMTDKTEPYPDEVFLEEKTITVSKKGETFNIDYSGEGPAK